MQRAGNLEFFEAQGLLWGREVRQVWVSWVPVGALPQVGGSFSKLERIYCPQAFWWGVGLAPLLLAGLPAHSGCPQALPLHPPRPGPASVLPPVWGLVHREPSHRPCSFSRVTTSEESPASSACGGLWVHGGGFVPHRPECRRLALQGLFGSQAGRVHCSSGKLGPKSASCLGCWQYVCPELSVLEGARLALACATLCMGTKSL